MSSDDHLNVTRQDLYELVWSKPLVELAKDFGLSDVALAKRCRKLGIPVPGRGYWARVAAGQSPRQPPLKKREEKPLDYSALHFDAPREPAEQEAPPKGTDEIALRERIAVLQPMASPDHSPLSPAVKRTAVLLERQWRKEITWGHGEKTGPVIRVDVSDLVVDRALHIADQVVSRASLAGWPFQTPPTLEDQSNNYRHHYVPAPELPVYGCLSVQGEPIAFRIDERRRQVDHVLTIEEKERKRRGQLYFQPRWDLIPTGELRLHLLHTDATYTFQTWKDSPKRPLEDQINTILLGFLDDAMRTKARREERRLAEIERRRKEELRWRQSERRSANEKLIHTLEAQAGAWQRARFLRCYLRALKRTIGEHKIEVMLDKQPVDFLSWAEHYVDQLDPLSNLPHDADLMEDNLRRHGADEAVHQMLSRLMGRHWQESWKAHPSSEDSESTEDDLEMDD